MSARDALFMLVVWTASVAAVTLLAIGFAGGIRYAFEDNLVIFLILGSPIIPLVIWLWKLVKHKPVPEKPE